MVGMSLKLVRRFRTVGRTKRMVGRRMVGFNHRALVDLGRRTAVG